MDGSYKRYYYLMEQSIDAIKTDFFWFHCHWGLKGVEKSNSVLGFAFDLLKRLYPTWTADKLWYWVKKLIVFDIPSYDATIEEALDSEVAYGQEGFKRVPFLIWDDMGLYFSKRRALTNDKRAWLDEFDAVREELAILIATMPKPDKPQKGLREEYTHEIHWRKRGYGWVEYYEQSISKKAGESTVRKKLIHGIASRWIPEKHFIDYRLMKKDAKTRVKMIRQMNFTPKDIDKLIANELGFVRDQDVLWICFQLLRRTKQASTQKVHELYKETFKKPQPYDGYLTNILRHLHGLNLIVYKVRGTYGEVTMTQKGTRTIEVLKDLVNNPIETSIKP